MRLLKRHWEALSGREMGIAHQLKTKAPDIEETLLKGA